MNQIHGCFYGLRAVVIWILVLATGWAVAQPTAVDTKSAGQRPNILLIVADDLGYAGLGVQGSKDIPTPNIDSIAANGVRFTTGYVSCPVCAPTRAGLLTGRYQQRYGFENNPGPPQFASPKFGLPLSEKTLAERLRPEGYATGMVGKWHLGFKPELQPLNRGFEEFFGFLPGAHAYLGDGNDEAAILRGTEPVREPEYLTDAFGREAVAYIERHREKPFFLYLPFNAVHAPLQVIQKYEKRFPAITDPKRRTHVAMVSALDDAVGRVLGAIRAAGLEERTLIIFISDNGGPTPQTTSSNAPLRGYKGQVFEGGIRVPFMMQWKGRLPGGTVFEHPVIALDIVPTALAAAGVVVPPEAKFDGRDLLPYLAGEKRDPPHGVLYWRYGDQSAIRMGDWKLVMLPGERPSLHNLAADIAEMKDEAEAHPAKVAELKAAYAAWNAELQAPKWVRETGDGRRTGGHR